MLHKILLVDDNAALLLSLKHALGSHYWVDLAQTGQRAIEKLSHGQYQCVLLDLNLPDISGMDVCLQVRQSRNVVPIIMLSGDDAVAQKADLLDAGADDYLTKPITIVELEARLRAAIRRVSAPQALGSRLLIGETRLDSLRHKVQREGIDIRLRPKEFALLECLMHHAGQVVSRPVLLHYAWEESADVWANVVDVHIKHLRDRFDRPFEIPLIKTVHGLGYKFDASNVANITKGGNRHERTIASRID